MPNGFLRSRCSVRGACSTVETTAFQRSMPAGAPLTKRCSVQRTLNEASLARTTLVIYTDTDQLGKTTGWIHRTSLKARRVAMTSGASYDRIDDAGLHVTVDGQPQVLEVDNIVVCAGQEVKVSQVFNLLC